MNLTCSTSRHIRRALAMMLGVVVLGMAVAGMPAIALAADSWSISIGVRETGTSAAIGDDGGSTGGIEWINLDGQSIIADGLWHQYTWNFGTDPVTNFSGGNGVLSSATMKGTLENIRILNSGGNAGGAINLRIDNIVNTVGGVPMTVSGFETSEGYITTGPDPLLSGEGMFRDPIFTSTTLGNMSTGLNSTLVSTTAQSGSQSMAARWSFVPDGSTSRWLRLSTASGGGNIQPNPTINFTSGNSLSIWMRAGVVNPSGTRAFGVDVSQFQGTGIDWNRVAAPQASGGAGLTFAFIRATRGGTSGTSTTGAMRVDDTTFSYNITNAKAAGLLTGMYHFGRPDMWTAGDANGNGDAPASVGTPEDEARHFLEIGGKYMKVGYMRPVYDLEDGGEEQNNAQMTAFVNRFANTLMKYKGPGAKILVYAGSSYASQVNSSISQYPLWMPAWPSDPNPWANDPFTSESSYGVWDPPGTGNPMPWSFWQYNAPDVYIPGINGSGAVTHNDIDVAHGDVNYVRQFLIQGSIWDGSSSAVWSTAANWDSNAEPISTTEVLFDGPVPGTGSSITLSSGRAASGIYFAESYTLTGGSLTLNDGRIDVDATKSATIATNLSTPNGFRKVGTGSLTHTSGTSTVTGIAQVLQGTMNVSGGSIAVSGNLLVNPELTQFDKSLVAPLPTMASQITNSTLTINGGSVSAAAAFVGGSDTTSGAIGTLTVSSGSLSVTGALKIWNSAVPLVNSKVNFSGGSMSLGSLNTDGDVTSFNWTGGALTIGGDNSSSTFNALGTGSASLVKTGTGVVTLAVANTYSGTTTVNGGTLRAGVNSALSTTTDLSVSSGTFDLNGFTTSIRGLSGSGSITLGSGALTVSPVGVSVFTGAISGAGSLSKSGTGTITLSGINTYTGATNINAGKLSLGNDNGLSSSTAVTVSSGATFDVNGRTSTVGSVADAGSVLLSGGSLTAGGNNTSTLFSGTISGAGTVTKTGSGNMTLSGANTYTGDTRASGGTLTLAHLLALQNSTLDYGSYGGSVSFGTLTATTFGGLKGNQNMALTNGFAANVALSVGNNNASTTYSGALSGGGSLTKIGSGILTLSGANTYTGGTTIGAGTLTLGSSGAVGTTGTLSFTGGTFQFSASNTTDYSARFSTAASQQFNLDTNGQSVTLASNLSSTGGTLTKLGAGTLTLSGTNSYTGATTVSAGTLQIGNGGATGSLADTGGIVNNSSLIFNRNNTYNYGGAISGTGTVTKLGAGALTLSGVSSYSGGTDIQNGTLSGNSIANQGTDSAFGRSNFLIANGATLAYTGPTASTNRTITLGTGGGMVSVSLSGSLTVNGVIDGSALTKSGGGNLVLGAANTYTGATTVTAGRVTVSGTSASLGDGDVTVQGATSALWILNGVADAIDDDATLNLFGGGNMDEADQGYASLGSNVDEAIDALFLGGIAQANGITYGSSSSDALFQSDEYFATTGTGVLSVGLLGDFNSDHTVDAGDYVTLRKSPSKFGGFTAAYELLFANLGSTEPLGGGGQDGNGGEVPEPSSIAFISLMTLGLGSLTGRRRGRMVEVED